MTTEWLTTSEFAAEAGVTPAGLRGQISRGQAPRADDPGTGPRWRRSTVDAYLATRPGQGARTDLVPPAWRYGHAIGAASLAADLVDTTLGSTDARDRIGKAFAERLQQPHVMRRLLGEMASQWTRRLRRSGADAMVTRKVDALLAELEQVPELPAALDIDEQSQALVGYHHRRGDALD